MNRLHWIAIGGMVGGLVLVLVLGWQFLLKPLGVEREAKLVEHAELVKQLEHTKAQAAQFEKFKAQAENVRRDLDFYSRRLDPDFPATELYSLVSGLGNGFNLANWSYEVKERTKTKTAGLNLDEVDVRARFNSDFERVGRFMNVIVSQTRLLVPETFILNRLNDTSGIFVDTLSADITFKVFVSPEEKK